jgi:phosphate starvation-inducible protein PhoH
MSKKKNKRTNQPQNHFSLREIKPLTPNQEETFQSFAEGKHLLLHGVAGTGKTFISLYLALDQILNKQKYHKVLIIRSAVASRDVGFLPGNLKEKTKVYEDPYKTICDDLFGRGDGYEVLKTKNLVEFTTTSYLRGLTWDNTIVVVDELQNMGYGELSTIMTRLGTNCRIIFCGDFRQTDLDSRWRMGLHHFRNIIRDMKEFSFIEFTENDIVRSPLVKSFIICQERYKERNNLVL